VHDGTVHGDRTELYLLRHADAGDPEAWTGSDDARPLSSKGEKQSRRLGRFLAELGFRPGAIVTSPKVRARDTARIVAEILGVEATIDERLGGGLDAVAIEAILFDVGEPERPVLVGHDPDFSDLAAWMIGAQWLSLKKGALVRIDTVRPISADSGTLRWLVPPDLLQGR
jgi:phosphohistidine phosphatase